MALVRSGLFMNWTAVTFTPNGGSAIPILRVTSCKLNQDSDQEDFKGDAAVFKQAIAVPTHMRTIELDTGDVGVANGLVLGAQGTFSATWSDYKNGVSAGGGAITVTLVPCTLISVTSGGDHAKFGSATVKFEGFNPDGITDPLTVTAL